MKELTSKPCVALEAKSLESTGLGTQDLYSKEQVGTWSWSGEVTTERERIKSLNLIVCK
jgi:hypothetical protein